MIQCTFIEFTAWPLLMPHIDFFFATALVLPQYPLTEVVSPYTASVNTAKPASPTQGKCQPRDRVLAPAVRWVAKPRKEGRAPPAAEVSLYQCFGRVVGRNKTCGPNGQRGLAQTGPDDIRGDFVTHVLMQRQPSPPLYNRRVKVLKYFSPLS